MTNAIDRKILEALGLPSQNCMGFTMNFRPYASPTVSVRYFVDAAQAEAIANEFKEYELVPADHA